MGEALPRAGLRLREGVGAPMWRPANPEDFADRDGWPRLLGETYPTAELLSGLRHLAERRKGLEREPLLLLHTSRGWGGSHLLRTMEAALRSPESFTEWCGEWELELPDPGAAGAREVFYTDLERGGDGSLWEVFFDLLRKPELREIYGDYLNFPAGEAMLDLLEGRPFVWLIDNLSGWLRRRGNRAPVNIEFLRSLVLAAGERSNVLIAAVIHEPVPEFTLEPVRALTRVLSLHAPAEAPQVLGHRLFRNWRERDRDAAAADIDRLLELYAATPALAAELNRLQLGQRMAETYPFHPDLIDTLCIRLSDWQAASGATAGYTLALTLLGPALRAREDRPSGGGAEGEDGFVLLGDIDIRHEAVREAAEDCLGPVVELALADIERCSSVPLAAPVIVTTMLYTRPEMDPLDVDPGPRHGASYSELIRGVLRPRTAHLVRTMAEQLRRIDAATQSFLFDTRIHRYRLGHRIMGPLQHLIELRARIIRSGMAFAVAVIAALPFAKAIFRILASPLMAQLQPGQRLVYTDPPEAFLTYLRVALITGLLLASPFIFYQLWSYLDLLKQERRRFGRYVAISTGLLLAGAGFGFFIVFPVAFRFFLGVAGEEIAEPMLRMASYFSFAIKLLIAFAVVFQLPLVINFLAHAGLVTAQGLARGRKIAVVIAVVVGALLTPPDVISQLLLAGPILILYEIGILMARRQERRREASPSV
jgi:sec-independent protein translocase protein TatC